MDHTELPQQQQQQQSIPETRAVNGNAPLPEEQQESSFAPPPRGPPSPQQPLEIAAEQSTHPNMSFVHSLSPSAAAAVSESSRKRRFRQRWPSFSLEVPTGEVNIANTSFLFADQLMQTNEDNLREGGPSPGKGGRRVPINILKLPWQHPFRNHESNRNPYKLPRALFAAILLTTTLALFSAWDAQNHCISNETDALMALLGGSEGKSGDNASGEDGAAGDADDIYASEMLAVKATCRQMFRQVMVPVGLITGAGSLSALGILRQHQRSYGKTSDGSRVPLMAQSPPCFYSFYLPLLFVSGMILAAWTVGIITVMLRPRTNDTDNPYTSLAAVDKMGRVADNANLYYLSWISEGLALLITYQLGGAFVRQHWLPTMITAPTPGAPAMTAPQINPNPSTVSAASSAFLHMQKHALVGSHMISAKNSMDNSLLQFPSVSSMPGALPATAQRYHSSRIKWFQTFYKLRVRTGMWVAALLCSLVVVSSSAHLFHEVLLPAALSLYDDDDYISSNDRIDWWNVVEENKLYGRVCVVLANQDSNLSETLCKRTFFALLSGFVAVILCGTAIVLHLLTRRSAAADALYVEACGGVYHELALEMMVTKNHHFPLRSELLLSVVLSLWMGWNALWVSSVQGPAPRVGNLYYGSWLCFLLCLRIGLGCVEEYFNIDNESSKHEQKTNPRRFARQPSYRAPNLPRDEEANPMDASDNPNSQANQEQTDEAKDEFEKERAKRLRRYFFLGAFSTVCAGSAFDAAANQGFVLTRSEKYMIWAPTAVAVLSAVMFLLCLSKVSYSIVSRFWCGGVLSLVCFEVWLLDLVLTMHSHDSWAVNNVGEIEMANLYYFSWASIITAGLQAVSYFKEALGLESEDYMSVVWAAIGKVCFVILGAALHIWHSISDQCDIVEIQNSAITFCSRTVLAMIVAATGIVISGVVVSSRILVPTRCISTRSRAHCEAVTSIFLMFLYGVATAMVTGIGSPGQSVGDLYYSTWLAFIVSIGIFVSAYDQIKVEEMAAKESERPEESEQNRSSGVGVMA